MNEEYYLKIGEWKIVREGSCMKTVVGSCIALCVQDPKTRYFGMVHIMLPSGKDKPDNGDGKYADRAVKRIIDAMKRRESRNEDLVITVAGGASMFYKEGEVAESLRVGNQNKDIVLEELNNLGLKAHRIVTGGSLGRKIVMTGPEQRVEVRHVGTPIYTGDSE